MPAPSGGLPGKPDWPLMLQMDLDIGDFSSDWSHCDLISTYLARMVSHNRLDSLLFANLYSSALNELLEAVFRTHGGAGQLHCAVLRDGGRDRIELVFPAGDDICDAYKAAVGDASGERAEQLYLDALFSEQEPEFGLGLLELGVDYGAKLSVQPRENGRLCLVAELALEEDRG